MSEKTQPVHTAEVTGSRRSLADGLRQDIYLTKVDWALETDVGISGKERRDILRGLKADIASEDPSRSMKDILADLGNPTRLAFSFDTDAPSLRPKWIAGAVSAGLAVGIYWVLYITYALGMLVVLQQSALQEAHATFFFTPTTVFDNDMGFGVEWTVSGTAMLPPLLLGLVVFLFVSRSWRALSSRK